MPNNIRRALFWCFIAIGVFSTLYVLGSASIKGEAGRFAKFAEGEFATLRDEHPSRAAPDAVFTGPDGADVQLSDFQGQSVLLNFWATWCPPCEREMPSLAALQNARGGEAFTVLTISVDGPEHLDHARERLEHLSSGTLPLYHLKEQDWSVVYESGARVFPTTVLIDRTGHIVAKMEGDADWADYTGIAIVDELIGE